jgi:pyridoxal phosphate enzyme (YggS family)
MDRSLWIQENYRQAKLSIPDHVELVVVSKNFPISDVRMVYSCGNRVFGENYAQELLEKAAALPQDIKWHFIGGLQSNKINMLLKCINVTTLQTVDSVEKAELIEKYCNRIGRQVDIYLQVNASGEPGKHGLHPSVVEPAALHILSNLKRCLLVGLMMIGSMKESSRAEGENREFVLMKSIRDDIERSSGVKLKLSMGMSQDYKKAVDQGSDLIRVGSAIFGSRPPQMTVKTDSEPEHISLQ